MARWAPARGALSLCVAAPPSHPPAPPPRPRPQSAGGILLPDTGKKLNEGEVVAVGPGAPGKDGKLLPMSVAVGDRVLLPEYGGQAVKIGEEEFSLYREDEIRAFFGAGRGAAVVGGAAAMGGALLRDQRRACGLRCAARPQRTLLSLSHTYAHAHLSLHKQARSCSRRAY